MSDQRTIYFFGAGQADGGGEVKHLVGGKGASLADMTKAGLNVPPGFTISADCCARYFEANRQWPEGLEAAVRTGMDRLEQLAGRTFGKGDDPLLVAVRSGAAESMPGMMDTVLNVGLNPESVLAIANRTGRPRGAWEAYRHFLVMFGHTVGGVPEAVYTRLAADLVKERGKRAEQDLDGDEMQLLCGRFFTAFQQHAGRAMPTDPWEMLRQAINAVFDSWNTERAVTYRKHHKVEGLLGTAVNVQMMCPSEVSGVMFTINPVNPDLTQIIIEASYGLGEAIVLGKVTPDRFVLDKSSLEIGARQIAKKDRVITAVATKDAPVRRGRDAASLTDAQVLDLARLGLRVEGYFETPCDIEWAWADGQFYLLQARPIKRGIAVQREHVRHEEITALRGRAEPGGTVWARYNLAEILPAPTPMTWAIVSRFMSGKGGYGLMLRDLGFDPDPIIDSDGFNDLVCGRPYVNLSREPKLYFRDVPYGYRFADLKASPERAIYPQPEIIPEQRGLRFFWRFPVILFRMLRNHARMKRQSRVLHERLRREVFPQFADEVRQEEMIDYARLPPLDLLMRLSRWITRTLDTFARDSLKATVLAALAMEHLKQGLAKPLGPERARSAVQELMTGVRPDPEADLAGAHRARANRSLATEGFLVQFGHRGSQEMELAMPRWAEDPQLLPGRGNEPSPNGMPREADKETEADRWPAFVTESRLQATRAGRLEPYYQRAKTYLSLRETGKHYFMMGYALIRRALVEIGRRTELGDDIFFLVPGELPKVVSGERLDRVIAERKQRRELALGLEAPPVLFSDDLEAIGRPPAAIGGTELKGTPLSAGVASAPALVLDEPSSAPDDLTEYVLVCPSTDPAWVPLFLRAKGLVMETGGMLSHGAIVAREFGLPAVAGIPGIHRRLRTGQRLHVDGTTGLVRVFES